MYYYFNDLSHDLEIGHEIGFTYYGRRFCITNTHSGWILLEFHNEYL